MKVALIHYRLINRGGLENRLKNYSSWLIENGHEVDIICAKYDTDVDIPLAANIKCLPINWMPKQIKKWVFSRKVAKYLKAHSYDLSLSLGRTNGQEIVLAPSNHLGYMVAHQQKSKKLKDKIQIILDANSYHQSKLILAASEMIKQELIDLYWIKEDKIKVLPPPINKDYFPNLKNQQAALKVKWKLSPSKKSFLFVSTGHKNKGLALLNKLFAKLPSDEYELGIVGYPAVKPKYNNIKYIGYIKDPKALNELYAAADYTIHPSTYDAFGQIITESLYSGTPVIISKNVGAKEIVKKEYGTIVDNFEINTWLDLLKNIDQEAFEIPENIDDFLQLNLNNHMEVILNQKF